MQNRKIVRWVVMCVAVMLSTTLFAQTTATKNTYSIYSMYGIGEISTQGTLSTRSMGGAGLASRSATSINLLNPASYSIAIQNGILLDLGAEGSHITNAQLSGSSVSKSSYLAANIHNIAFQVPLAKGLGIGFSLAPYSSVGYNLNEYEKNTDIGLIAYNYTGTGDITEVKLGMGYAIAKGLSVGFSVQYYWGLLDRYYSLSILPITTNGSYSMTQGLSALYISKLKAQFGIQWDAVVIDTKRLTFGATYDMGGNIAPKEDVLVTSGSATDLDLLESVDEVVYPELNFPHQFSVGATYRDRKWHAAADFTLQMWGDNDVTSLSSKGITVGYTDVAMLKLGVEYTPNVIDARDYYKRVSYRAGLRGGNYYQTFNGEQLPQWAVTAGIGLPISVFGMSSIDLGVEYGGLGMLKSNLVRQNYFKLSFGITLFGDDYWFQRIKYD